MVITRKKLTHLNLTVSSPLAFQCPEDWLNLTNDGLMGRMQIPGWTFII
jgi:hypothetical protein